MKHYLIFLTIYCFPFYTNAQSEQKFTISEIGWTFGLPEGYKVIDTSSKTVQLQDDKHYWTKQLLFKSENASFFTSIMTMGPEDDEIWDHLYYKEKGHFYKTVSTQKPSLQLDSTTSSEIINSELFTKFTLVGKENGEIVYNQVQLRKLYKNYRFIISYNSIDTISLNKIEKMLQNSKFIK